MAKVSDKDYFSSDSAAENNFLDGCDIPASLQQLLMTDSVKLFDENEPDLKTLKPEPGFCVKTRDASSGEKIFLNICKSTELPAPRDLTDEELTDILQSETPSDYKVPLSLGESHPEVDKSGKACKVYDITINSEFFEKVKKNLLFKTFLITIAMEGLEDKYKVEIDKNDWTVLKNKLYLGKMPEITVRRKQTLITEISSTGPAVEPVPKNVNSCTIECVRDVVPEFKLQKFRESDAAVLKAEIKLPGVKCRDITLDIGEDHIVLAARPIRNKGQFVLDIFIPISVAPSKSSACFDAKQEILTVSMPFASNDDL